MNAQSGQSYTLTNPATFTAAPNAANTAAHYDDTGFLPDFIATNA